MNIILYCVNSMECQSLEIAFILIASDAYELDLQLLLFLFKGKCQDKASPVTL
jgi:hypothetical protein